MKIQRYKHDLDVSYTLGAAITYELIKCAPQLVRRIFISSSADRESPGIVKLFHLCEKSHFELEVSDRAFNILSPKGNCFVIAEFEKTKHHILDGSHIVLVNPSDAGNLGTIIRTAAGFAFNDIAVIRTAADCYDPHVVRASMGAIFHTRIEYFDTIESYRTRFPKNTLYAFMLTAKTALQESEIKAPYSLVFGNEGSGLSPQYADFCHGIIIPQTPDIDSLSLPMAAGIAMYEMVRRKEKRIS